MSATDEGVTLLGSEMLTWSDLDGEAGPFDGLLAPHLLHEFGGARERVLIAGPTATAVVLDVAGLFAGADVLVRSWPDAQHLRTALPREIGVFCGPLDRMVGTGNTYDAVIAVAGTDRLHSAEDSTPTVEKVLSDLVALAGPTGELYVGVGNPVGVDRLLSLNSSSRHHDAAWPDGHSAHGPEPTVESVLDLLVSAHGLTHVETWFCHGPRTSPLVASSSAVLVGASAEAVLLRALAGAYDVGSGPLLKDPAATVRDLARSGLAAATAPLAVAHLRKGAAAPAGDATLLVAEPATSPAAAAYRLSAGASGWTRDLLDEPTIVAITADLTRETARLVGPVPSGIGLTELVEECCAAHDVAAIGVLVRRYRDWLGDTAEGPVPAERVAVLPRDLVGDGDGFAVVDASWVTTLTPARDVVLLRGLLDLAADLLRRGIRHPWSPAASARVIAVELAAAAGIEVAAALSAAASDLDTLLRPEGTTMSYDEPAGLSHLTYAELRDVAEGLATRAADADQHVIWLLHRVQGRQRALRQTRGQLQAVNNSRELWVGRKIFRIREALRQREIRRNERLNPVGEWRDPSLEPVEEPEETIEIESDLIPPGYQPPPEITVVPPGPEIEHG